MEVGEDAKFGEECVARVQVQMIAATPIERVARDYLQAFGIDTTRLQLGDIRLRKVRAYDADEIDRVVERGRQCEIGRRTAQHTILRRERCLDPIQRD